MTDNDPQQVHSTLKIFQLGTFKLLRNGEEIAETEWHTRQARQLLKILLVNQGKIVPRDVLIEALWYDADPHKAATTLRTAVNALRKTLEPNRPPYTTSAYIVAHAPGYKFNFTADVWVDTVVFETCLDEAAELEVCPAKQALLTQAVALYKDDYLPEDLYADWSFQRREALRERYLEALTDLADCLAAQGDYQDAVGRLRRVLTHDPGREPVYRNLMRFHYQLGDTVAALKAYEQLRTYLSVELGVDPSTQTQSLHRAILNDQLTVTPSPRFNAREQASPFETIFVGRQAEQAHLTQLLKKASRHRGSVVTITGEAGVGKTRLVHQLLTQTQIQHFKVMTTRCQVVEQNLPFAPLIDALEAFIIRNPESCLQDLSPVDTAQLAQLLPSIAWQMEIETLATANANFVAGGAHSSSREVLVSSLVRILLTVAQRGLLLMIDDLQWVDEATLTILSKLSRYIPTHKILIVVAYRPEDVRPDAPLARFLRASNRQNLIEKLNLNRFEITEIDAYLCRLVTDLCEDVSLRDTITSRLYQLTGGNPLFLTETLKSYVPDGHLSADTIAPLAAQSETWQPSPQVTDVILNRVASLPDMARRLLDLAAVIGRDFSVDLLETITTSDPLPALSVLFQRGFMIETEQHRLDFSHRLVREVIYRELSPVARQRLHQRVARALITLHGTQSGHHSAEISEHSLLGGGAYRRQALTFAVLAGEYAMRTFGFEQAALHFGQALKLSDDMPFQDDLVPWLRKAYQGLGLAQESMACWDDAEQTYEAWRKWANRNHLPQLALMAQHRQATMYGLTGQLDRSAVLSASIARRIVSDTPATIVQAQARIGRLISTATDPITYTDAGWPVFLPSPGVEDLTWDNVIQFLGPEQAAQDLNLFGWALTLQGKVAPAEQILLRAGQLAEQYNQIGLSAISYHLLAQLWDQLGDYTRMESALGQALTLVEDVPHFRWAVIWGLIHQAYVDLRWNHLKRAESRLQALDKELQHTPNFRSHQLSVWVGLGLLSMFQQDLAVAANYFTRVMDNPKDLYASNYVVVYRSVARLKRKHGDLESAQAHIIKAMAYAGSRGMLRDYVSAAVEAAHHDRLTGEAHFIIPMMEQLETMAGQANLLPTRLSTRLSLARLYQASSQPNDAAWYRRLATHDRDTIAASIPNRQDRAYYLSRPDLRLL